MFGDWFAGRRRRRSSDAEVGNFRPFGHCLTLKYAIVEKNRDDEAGFPSLVSECLQLVIS